MNILYGNPILTLNRTIGIFLLTAFFCVPGFSQSRQTGNESKRVDDACELKVAVLDYQDTLIAGASVRFVAGGRSTETTMTARQNFESVLLLPGEYNVYVTSRFNSLIFGRSKFTLACPSANKLNLYPLFAPVSLGDNRPTPTCETVNLAPTTPSPVVMCCESRIKDGEYDFCHRPVVTIGAVSVRAAYVLVPQNSLEFRFFGEVRYEDSAGPTLRYSALTMQHGPDGLKETDSKK